MEVKFFIDTELKIIIEKFMGEIAVSTITKAIPYIWGHPDYSPAFDGIIDFRTCKVLFSMEEIHQLTKTIEEDDKGMQGKLAILVSEPLIAAMSTIYGDRMKEMHTVGVFCTEPEVMRFLGTTPDIFDKIDDPKAITINLE